MNNKAIEIFELCERLRELLGDKEAIADLNLLLERHPEMFKDMQDVSNVIREVVKEPEIITNAKRENAILAAKRLQETNKMGEIAVENDKGTNIIFHANKKNISHFDKLAKKQMSVEASSAKAAPTRSDRYASKSNDLPKCNEAPSTFAESIIPQSTNKGDSPNGVIQEMKDKVKTFAVGLKETLNKSLDKETER